MSSLKSRNCRSFGHIGNGFESFHQIATEFTGRVNSGTGALGEVHSGRTTSGRPPPRGSLEASWEWQKAVRCVPLVYAGNVARFSLSDCGTWSGCCFSLKRVVCVRIPHRTNRLAGETPATRDPLGAQKARVREEPLKKGSPQRRDNCPLCAKMALGWGVPRGNPR